MITAFSSSLSGTISASSFTASKLVARSTNSADTGTLTAAGIVSGTGASEAFSLLGQREVLGSSLFTKLSSAVLSASQLGTVSLFLEGTKAEGRIIVSTQPADGDTLQIGLTGFTQLYTYRAKARQTILCLAASGISQGDYFDLTYGGTAKRIWFDKDAAGTGAPSTPGGGSLHEVDILSADTAAQVATKLEVVIEAITNLTSSVDTATVTVDLDVLGTLVSTDGAAATGFTFTAVRTGTADAANQIAIGADAAATATNIKKAINAEGTAGTHYGTGTAINTYFTVSAISGQILTIQDKIGCVRSLSYVLTQGTGATLSLGLPTGGANGTSVATLQIGDVRAFNAVTLDDEALTLDQLPPLTDWYSDWVLIGGQRATIYLDCENVATGIAASYQTTTDSAKTVTRAGAVSISNADNNSQIITPTEVAEYIRLRLNNTNTTAAAVNAKVVTG
jgi:hypothetical protein